jgi:tRNA (guanine37-N1)-methyltransferase
LFRASSFGLRIWTYGVRFDVLTLFPQMFDGYVGQSLLAKAIAAGLVSVQTHDIRQWSRDKHHKVDDRPFGGGPGMVLRVEPVVECVEAVQAMGEPGHLVLLSPRGRRLTQQVVEELAGIGSASGGPGTGRLLLLCGRYEGFDQRVLDILQPDEISIGDYILNGGEVAAMVIIDAVIRLIPGVLGDEESSQTDSFSSGESSQQRLLEYGQYTRPREYRGHSVPEVLLSGNHEQIARWRREQSYLATRHRRADLLTPTQPPESHKSEP